MLVAAADAFPRFKQAVGIEVQLRCVDELCSRLRSREDRERIAIKTANFFDCDWRPILSALPDPILVIGNPPWVTNATLSAIGSTDLPTKNNFQGHAGLDALTGKSNFDISEAMLLKIVGWLAGRDAMLVMLCKTAVARKVLAHSWKHGLSIGAPSIRRIDAPDLFGASVDACVFECRFGKGSDRRTCPVYELLLAHAHTQTIAYRDGRMLADAHAFDRWAHLEGQEVYRWRSGIKHDCAEVVELVRGTSCFRRKDGSPIRIEDDFIYPMLKASDLGNIRGKPTNRWMLVTQRFAGDDTHRIAAAAPKTWAYLRQNADRFDRRASVIYKGRPPFSMFGLGTYSFAPWKVGIAGLYKKMDFKVIGPRAGKPVVLDDTCYFVSCHNQEEAQLIASLLNSSIAREFYSAFVFWDAKRPVTVELLRRLDLRRLASALGQSENLERFCGAARSCLRLGDRSSFGQSWRGNPNADCIWSERSSCIACTRTRPGSSAPFALSKSRRWSSARAPRTGVSACRNSPPMCGAPRTFPT